MPLLESVVLGPISKPCPACISKFYISYCCIIGVVVLQLFCTMLEKFSLYISFCKIFLFAHYRLIMYISLLLQLIFSYVYMLLKNSNCLVGPRDSRILTSSPLNRRSVRECVPYGARMLPPKLYLVVFYQVSVVNQTGLTCSDFKRPVEVLPGSACCTISHVHTPWGNCNKCSSMIVSIKDSVSQTLFVNPISLGCFFPRLLLVVE